jgi:hypothetical protein
MYFSGSSIPRNVFNYPCVLYRSYERIDILPVESLNCIWYDTFLIWGVRGGAVVEVLRYKPDRRGIDS